MPLRAIRLVTDSSGQALSRYPFQLEQTIDGKTIHLLQYILQETARVGTARSIYYSIPDSVNIAGKTGTSDQQRDSWFAGFAGNRLAVTWLGLDDNQRLAIYRIVRCITRLDRIHVERSTNALYRRCRQKVLTTYG